jgi:hypothetical protein
MDALRVGALVGRFAHWRRNLLHLVCNARVTLKIFNAAIKMLSFTC